MTNLQTLDLDYFKRIAARVTKEKQTPKVESNSGSELIKPITVSPFAHEYKNTFIYVPSINLYVSKQRTLQGKNWFDCHKELQANGERMPTIYEFVEFLKYLKTNPEGVEDASFAEIRFILDDILAVKFPYRAEWLNAGFKVKDKKLYLEYNHKFQTGKTDSFFLEPLEECLMEDRHFDLDSWLNNSTKQGLPKKDVASGSIMYLYPRGDNTCVGGFGADVHSAFLNCWRQPTHHDSGLGVRAVRENLEAIN